VNKFHFAEVHRITKGDKAVVALIDSEIDANQPNLVGHCQRPIQRRLRFYLPTLRDPGSGRSSLHYYRQYPSPKRTCSAPRSPSSRVPQHAPDGRRHRCAISACVSPLASCCSASWHWWAVTLGGHRHRAQKGSETKA
jgi:hypothetical protein